MTFTLTIRTAEHLEAERLAEQLRALRRRRDLAIAAGTVCHGIRMKPARRPTSRRDGRVPVSARLEHPVRGR